MAETSTTKPTEPQRSGRAMTLAGKVALNAGAQGLRQLYTAFIGIASVAIATRYLSIDDYGQIIVALTVVTLFAVAGDFGITATTARMMAQAPERRDSLASSAMWTWVAFCAISAVLVLGVTAIAYGGSEHSITRPAVLIILACSNLLTPFFGVANVTAIVEQRVWILALGTTAARTLGFTATVLAVVLDLGPLGIAWGIGLGFLLDALFGILLVHPRIPRARPDWMPIKALIAAAIPLGMVMVVNGLYFKLDAFLLSLLGTSNQVAIYGIGYRAFEILIVLPGFVMVTLLPVLASVTVNDPRFGALVQKAFTTVLLLAAPLAAFGLLGTEIMTLLGGSQYAEGGFVLAMILLGVAFACLNGVFGNALVSQGRQGVLLKVALLNLAINGVANVIAIPIWGASGAAVALALTEISSLLCTVYVFGRIAPLPRIENLGGMLVAILLTALATCVRFLLPEDDIVRLLVSGAFAATVYGTTLLALGALPPYIMDSISGALGTLRRRFA